MKTTIQKISIKNTDKDGRPLVAQSGPNAGQPYTRVSILIDSPEYAEKWLSGFGNDITNSWKVGDKVDIQITEKGQYLNFKPLSGASLANDEILDKLNSIHVMLSSFVQSNTQQNGSKAHNQIGEQNIDHPF